jgi:hypothetical protein
LLYLFSNKLSGIGTISNDIGNMTSLTDRDLYENNLEGSIPESIVKLHKLKRFYLYSNELSGTIPNDIGNMSTIPSTIIDLHLLEYLLLFNNLLSGPIPNNISRLSYNFLTGSLPYLASYTSIIDINHNLFTGELIDGPLAVYSLTYYDVSYNLLSQPLSSRYFPNIEYYYLNNLPDWIKDMNNLAYLIVSDNVLEGSIDHPFPATIPVYD